MARFCVYSGPDGSLLLDCQADVLDHLNTRLVVPLISPDSAPIAAVRLNPAFQIGPPRSHRNKKPIPAKTKPIIGTSPKTSTP